MKPTLTLFAISSSLLSSVFSHPTSPPVLYLGEPEPLWSGGAVARGLVFTGGTTGLLNGSIVEGGIENETAQTLANMAAIFEEAGTSWDNVLKVTCYLTNLTRDFDGMNRVYREVVPDPKPGRTTVEVSRFAGEFLVEMEAVAAIPYH